MFKCAAIALLISLTISFAYGQESLKSIQEDYYDYLSLTGKATRPTLGYRTLSDSKWTPSEDHVWHKLNLGTTHEVGSSFLRLYGPESFTSYNSKCPYGFNDGGLWQGRGFNTSLSAGARLEAYGFEFTLKPQISWSENKSYDYFTFSEYNSDLYKDKATLYGSKWLRQDSPQRFGDSSFFNFDWGDTEFRYSLWNFTLGVGFQSIWLGPSKRNAILHSNNASSYPKMDFGLRKTQVVLPGCHWNLGYIEGRVWTGYLSESKYFDNDSDNDHNMFHGLSISYAPSFIPGLVLTGNRTCLVKWKLSNFKYIVPVIANSHVDDGEIGEDQKISFAFDWNFNKVGLELYGELGVDDPTTASYYQRSFVYTMGLSKDFCLSNKYNIGSVFNIEISDTQETFDFYGCRYQYSFGSHSQIQQGYTNKGQYIGLGQGYGGTDLYISYKVIYPRGYVKAYVDYLQPDNNMVMNSYVTESNDNLKKSTKMIISYGGELNHFFTKSFSSGFDFAFQSIKSPMYKSCTWDYNINASVKLVYFI